MAESIMQIGDKRQVIKTSTTGAVAMAARCLAVGENTATIDFYVGIHEYEG